MKFPKWLRVLIPSVLIAIWLGLGAVGGPYFGRVEEVSEIDLAAFLPNSAEATKVNNESKKFRSEETIPAIVVFESQNELSETQLETVNALPDSYAKVESVSDVAPAVQSEDKKAAFVVIPIQSEASVDEVLERVRETTDGAGLEDVNYKITGPAGFSADLAKAFSGIDGLLLITALSVVFVILIVVYRSVLLPVVVLLTSILALSASIFIVWQLANNGVVQLNGQVQGILFILVIGAATDYSLLYVSRYREALYQFRSKYDATLAALKGALEPILASGGTVIVGLLCLLLSDLASNTALGPVGALGIVMAMASALTFLPATLYVLGRASFWPIRPKASKQAAKSYFAKQEKGIWAKVGRLVERRQRLVWVASVAILVVAAGFMTQLKADGVAQSDLILGSSEARDGQTVLNKHFPDGSGSPAQIIAPEPRLDEIVARVDALEGVDGVSVVAENTEAGFKPVGKSEREIKDEIRSEVQAEYTAQLAELDATVAEVEASAGPFVAEQVREQALANIPSVESIVDEAYPFQNATVKVVDGNVLVQATLTDAPDSEAAKETVVRLRDAVHAVDNNALVGGITAVQLDTNTASINDRMLIIPVVLVAITVILMLLLRSVVAPILLLLTTVLSFASALGVAALLFNHVWNFPGADPSVILYAFVFLVALGIDYNIFLMTRVREEVAGQGTARGVIKGLVVTGGVITSAGIVLAATFAALGVIPILFLFQLAFIVSFGVLLDTFLVRSLLVPALIRDIGPFVWWPSKLRHKP